MQELGISDLVVEMAVLGVTILDRKRIKDLGSTLGQSLVFG